jgi:cation diffusion facilitator family transporter
MKKQKRVVIVAIVLSIALVCIKYTAYLYTNSTVILADAAEGIVNVVASCFALFSITLAAKPRDKDHPYGHGKIEFFSVGIEGILISIASILIIMKGITALFMPSEISEIGLGTFLIAITAVANFVMGRVMIHYGNKEHSITLIADGKHLLLDTISTCSFIVGLGVIYFTGFEILDSIFSIMAGFYILYIGYGLCRKFVAGLMDETDFELLDKVAVILNDNRRSSWVDIHNLRSQQYGSSFHIDCHLTLPRFYGLEEAHDEVTAVSKLISEKFNNNSEFFIHADPCLPECCKHCSMVDCPVRSESFKKTITWTVDTLIKDEKHI